MSDTASNELLMYFVQSPGSDPIKAESTSELVGADQTLMTGFKAGRYFEAESFAFSINLQDDESGSTGAGADKRSFSRWRGLRETRLKPNPPFRAEPEEVSIERLIDSSSPILLSFCLESKPFDTVVMVKRARMKSNGKLAVLLRMEFKKVWIRSIKWKDGNSVTESCKFKFNSVDIKYVRHKPDGTVDSVWPCSWSAR